MFAIAALRLGRLHEAGGHFDHALSIDPTLAATIDQLRGTTYDTLLIVDYGIGPTKIATGPGGVIAAFVPRTDSDARPLLVDCGGGASSQSYPVACDLNDMATHHMWRNLEDVRRAKSVVGTLLMGTGTGSMRSGVNHRDAATGLIGLGMVLAGGTVRASAWADTRYCEILPQRVYIVPLAWPHHRQSIRLEIEGLASTRFEVTGLHATGNNRFKVGYVRLVTAAVTAPQWATSGQILYANDAAPGATSPNLPYILGGNCVRTPTPDTLDNYRRHGLPASISLTWLEALYHLEGIVLRGDTTGPPGRHFLEGGRSLAPPAPGTAGFSRVFGQSHAAYQPRSRRVKELASTLREHGAIHHNAKDPA